MYLPPHLPDTQALNEFREKSASVLKRLARTERPLLLTQNGKAAGVVLSPHAYEQLADAADLATSIAGIRQSLAEIRAGKTIPLDTAFKQLKAAHHTSPKRS